MMKGTEKKTTNKYYYSSSPSDGNSSSQPSTQGTGVSSQLTQPSSIAMPPPPRRKAFDKSKDESSPRTAPPPVKPGLVTDVAGGSVACIELLSDTTAAVTSAASATSGTNGTTTCSRGAAADDGGGRQAADGRRGDGATDGENDDVSEDDGIQRLKAKRKAADLLRQAARKANSKRRKAARMNHDDVASLSDSDQQFDSNDDKDSHDEAGIADGTTAAAAANCGKSAIDNSQPSFADDDCMFGDDNDCSAIFADHSFNGSGDGCNDDGKDDDDNDAGDPEAYRLLDRMGEEDEIKKTLRTLSEQGKLDIALFTLVCCKAGNSVSTTQTKESSDEFLVLLATEFGRIVLNDCCAKDMIEHLFSKIPGYDANRPPGWPASFLKKYQEEKDHPGLMSQSWMNKPNRKNKRKEDLKALALGERIKKVYNDAKTFVNDVLNTLYTPPERLPSGHNMTEMFYGLRLEAMKSMAQKAARVAVKTARSRAKQKQQPFPEDTEALVEKKFESTMAAMRGKDTYPECWLTYLFMGLPSQYIWGQKPKVNFSCGNTIAGKKTETFVSAQQLVENAKIIGDDGIKGRQARRLSMLTEATANRITVGGDGNNCGPSNVIPASTNKNSSVTSIQQNNVAPKTVIIKVDKPAVHVAPRVALMANLKEQLRLVTLIGDEEAIKVHRLKLLKCLQKEEHQLLQQQQLAADAADL